MTISFYWHDGPKIFPQKAATIIDKMNLLLNSWPELAHDWLLATGHIMSDKYNSFLQTFNNP